MEDYSYLDAAKTEDVSGMEKAVANIGHAYLRILVSNSLIILVRLSEKPPLTIPVQRGRF